MNTVIESLPKLNMGAGKTKIKGFVAVDLYDNAADLKRDCADTGIASCAVGEIYASHLIEHLEVSHCKRTLEHWFDILAVNGKLTIRCPNAEVWMREWLTHAKNNDLEQLLGWAPRYIMGWEDKGEGMWHRRLFSANMLRHVVEQAGFRVVSCTEYKSRCNSNHFEYRENGDLLCVAYKN